MIRAQGKSGRFRRTWADGSSSLPALIIIFPFEAAVAVAIPSPPLSTMVFALSNCQEVEWIKRRLLSRSVVEDREPAKSL